MASAIEVKIEKEEKKKVTIKMRGETELRSKEAQSCDLHNAKCVFRLRHRMNSAYRII